MILVDANILLYAEDQLSPWQTLSRTRTWLRWPWNMVAN